MIHSAGDLVILRRGAVLRHGIDHDGPAVCIVTRALDRIGRQCEILAPTGRVLRVPSFYLMPVHPKSPHG